MIIRRYSELIRLKTFEERFEYLRLGGLVGDTTFGFDRILNQTFYHSSAWRSVRNKVILRDNGCDMGHDDYPIGGRVIIHHLNPISLDDIMDRKDDILNPEYLVCVSENTHNAIHFGDFDLLPKPPIERRPNDTCPWKG